MIRLKIGQKLGLGFGGVLLLMVIDSVVVQQALDKINISSKEVMQEAIPILRACDELLISINQTTSSSRGMTLLGDKSPMSPGLRSDFDLALTSMTQAVERLLEIQENSGHVVLQDLHALEELADSFKQTQLEVVASAQKKGTDANQDLQPTLTLMEQSAVPKTREIRKMAEKLRDEAVKQMNVARDTLEQNRIAARSTLLLTTVLAILLGSTVAILLSRSLVVSIRSLLDRVHFVAQGDLTQPELQAITTDEVGDLTQGFNQMVSSLRSVLNETDRATSEVSSASRQIATGAQQQLASLNETAASLNEITTTAEEFKATMQEFADRAKAVHEAADETARRTAEGLALSKESAVRIQKVHDNSLSAGESVLQLAEQTQRISEITASVHEIAEQTKLLALNASIEAARAGEEGRGFAVVAMQVRELANQSKEAAGRIEGLITQTQKSMQSVIGKIEEGGRLSEDSTTKVLNVSVAFDEIAKAIEQTRQAMAQINTGARQQELGITELVSSIVEIDSASKETVAAAEQTQQAIHAIDVRLHALDALVNRFKT